MEKRGERELLVVENTEREESEKKRGEFCVTPAFTPEPCGISKREWEGNNVLESEPAAPRAQFAVGVCARRTRARGEHVPTGHERHQRPAAFQRNQGKSRLPFLFFVYLGIVCVSCGGLVR